MPTAVGSIGARHGNEAFCQEPADAASGKVAASARLLLCQFTSESDSTTTTTTMCECVSVAPRPASTAPPANCRGRVFLFCVWRGRGGCSMPEPKLCWPAMVRSGLLGIFACATHARRRGHDHSLQVRARLHFRVSCAGDDERSGLAFGRRMWQRMAEDVEGTRNFPLRTGGTRKFFSSTPLPCHVCKQFTSTPCTHV
jgi:hypothetical protein